jgi:hypothetical protein
MISGALPPVSNRETLNLQIELYDDEANDLIDVAAASEAVIAVASAGCRSPVLTARLSAGQIAQTETGVIECTFSADQMSGLCAGTYDIGGTLTKDGETVQFMIGTLPVYDGIVR